MNSRILLLTLALAVTARAETSPLGEGDSYAWAANLGWFQLKPERPAPGDGIVITDTLLSGFAWSDSTGWINFGDGTPAGKIRYSNIDGADSGVNHDGAGNLSGLAWSANLGWINFGWAAPSDANRPRFDLISGVFSGLAWSSNAGWINLDTGLLKTDAMCITDADGDGISDAWETAQSGGTKPLTATGDYDKDGKSDLDEYHADTDPMDPNELFTVLSLQPSANGSVLTWTSKPTRLYRISQSTTLTDWATGSLLAPDPGTQTTREGNHGKSTRRFFRVVAELPLRK